MTPRLNASNGSWDPASGACYAKSLPTLKEEVWLAADRAYNTRRRHSAFTRE
jgi:hypothetical protein